MFNSFIDYMPLVCVDVVIIHNNKCLLLKRKNWPAKNQYWLPGGRILKNESIKEATIRKVKEETNLNTVYRSFLTVEETFFQNDQLTKHTINLTNLVVATTDTGFRLDNQHSNFKWLEKDDPFLLQLDDAVQNPIRCAYQCHCNGENIINK